jgi:glycosyltransferase involved in cell wall biosynthesis
LADRLKVCVISTESIPVYGGIGAYTTQLVEHLPEDIEVHLVTVNRNIQGRSGSGYNSANTSLKRKVNFHFLSMSNDDFLYYPFFQLACFRRLQKLADQYKFDLIHTQFPVMPDLLVRLFRRTRIPAICTIHSSVETQMDSIKLAATSFSELDRAEKGNFLLFYPLKSLQYLFLKGLEWYITVSDFVRNEVVKSYPFLKEKKISTVYHGVDTGKFFPFQVTNKSFLNEEKQPIILFTGRMVAKKGPHVLIHAIPEVLKRVPNACFVFAGGGNFAPYMKLIQQLKINKKNYRYLGYVEASELPELYNLASVYAAPSFEDSLGIRILEAMSCRKAVVASDVGGVHEIVEAGKNGLLVEPGDQSELASNIITLLEDDGLREEFAEAGRQKVLQGFSSIRMASETASLYHKLLDNSNWRKEA